eukprot:scaffold47246_cov81-Phaeocystis_antarctica.AAC.8
MRDTRTAEQLADCVAPHCVGQPACRACPQASWRPASKGRVRDVLVKIISFGAHLEHDDLGELRTSPRRHAVVRELDRVIHGNVHDAKQACGSVNLTVNEVSVRQVSVLVGVRITDAERLVITSFSDGLSQHRGLKRSPHVDADAGADHCKKPHWCLLRDRLEHVAAVSDFGPLVVSERPAHLVRWAMNPQTRVHEKVVRRIGKRNNSILIIDQSRAARAFHSSRGSGGARCRLKRLVAVRQLAGSMSDRKWQSNRSSDAPPTVTTPAQPGSAWHCSLHSRRVVPCIKVQVLPGDGGDTKTGGAGRGGGGKSDGGGGGVGGGISGGSGCHGGGGGGD